MKILSQFAFLLLVILTIGCTSEPEAVKEEAPKTHVMEGVTIPIGFKVETLYKPQDHEEGSWVSMTKDDKGRLYTSDQYGNLYRVTLPALNSKDSVNVEKLDLNIGQAQGMLWHEGVLYTVVNSNENRNVLIKSGFYKVTDNSGDGEFDTVKEIKTFDGQGEHGPHNIILAPDKKSLYVVAGNHTDIPDDFKSIVPEVWDEDNLLTVIKDPSGHANSRKAPGGWVAQTDFDGKEWTLTNVGLRNTYDIAFNRDGDLFGFDSDMEYDLGMPWYRPIRLCHFIGGAEFGWRTGTGKFRAEWPDNMPGIANLGQGSPTGLMNGHGLKFPEYYQDGLFLYDWSYGTMYYVKLTPEGGSYSTEVSEFLSGVPLPLTNGIAGDDGALYFLTGGRRLGSALYKVTYTGDEPSDIIAMTENAAEKDTRALRRKLEALQGKNGSDQIDFIVSNMDHADRSVRYVARIALENQDYSAWKDEINKSSSPEAIVQLALSVARHGSDSDRINALKLLSDLNWSSFAESKKTDYIRAIDLVLTRTEGAVPTGIQKSLVDAMLPRYLAESPTLNKELCKVLSYLQASEIIAPTLEKMDTDTIVTDDQKSIYLSSSVSQRSERYGKNVEKMLANMPNQQNISYAKSLSEIKTGWTKELSEKYFRWYNRALKRSGGLQYGPFMRAIQNLALNNVDKDDRQYYEALAGEGLKGQSNYMANVTQPKGPGKSWTKQSVLASYGKGKPNFESGKNLYKASLCISCHSMGGEGGSAGPELTQVGTRFSVGDLAEAIITPGATVSDRYRNTNYHMKDGKVVSGRLIEETDRHKTISTNPFSPDLTTNIRKTNIVKEEESPNSPMPAGLMNRLNDQEMNDLIAYLIAGGSKDAEVYK